jgi:hypothetical protein
LFYKRPTTTGKRDDAKRAHDVSIEFHSYTNKAAIDGANLALRTLVVINRGAAIAVLTFLGGVASKDRMLLRCCEKHEVPKSDFYQGEQVLGLSCTRLKLLLDARLRCRKIGGNTSQLILYSSPLLIERAGGLRRNSIAASAADVARYTRSKIPDLVGGVVEAGDRGVRGFV